MTRCRCWHILWSLEDQFSTIILRFPAQFSTFDRCWLLSRWNRTKQDPKLLQSPSKSRDHRLWYKAHCRSHIEGYLEGRPHQAIQSCDGCWICTPGKIKEIKLICKLCHKIYDWWKFLPAKGRNWFPEISQWEPCGNCTKIHLSS